MQIYHYLLFNKHSFSEFGIPVGFHMFEKSSMIMELLYPSIPTFADVLGKTLSLVPDAILICDGGKLGPIMKA